MTCQSTCEPWWNSETQLIGFPILYKDTLMYFDWEEKSIGRILNEEAASPLCSQNTLPNLAVKGRSVAQGLIFKQSIGKMIKYKKTPASINYCKAVCITSLTVFASNPYFNVLRESMHVCHWKHAALCLYIWECRWLCRRHHVIWAEADTGYCSVTLL